MSRMRVMFPPLFGSKLHDDFLELRDRREVAFHIDRQLEISARRRRRHADLSGSNTRVLLLDGGDDIARHQRALQHLLRIEPDPHAVLADAEDVHVRDPGHAGEFVAQLERREITQEERVVFTGGRGERDDLQDGRGFFLRHHTLLLDGLRELRECGGNAVLHQHLREVEVRADLERDRQGVAAVGRAGGLHVEHVLDAVDLLLDGKRDGLNQRLRIRAGIIRRHLNRRRRDRRVLRDRQIEHRHSAEQHRDQRDDIRQHRPLDEEFGEHDERLADSGRHVQ